MTLGDSNIWPGGEWSGGIGQSESIEDARGTCFGGAGKLTDADGKYVFPERTFRNFPALSASMPGRYHVSTDYRGPALHDSKSDQPRTADFVLGTPAAVTVTVKGEVPAGWNQTVLLRAGRDATVHRYDLSGVHSEGWDSWRFNLVPRSNSYHVVVVQQPKFEPTDDLKELREKKRQSAKQQVETFGDYVAVGDGYAPKTLRLQADHFDFRLQFKVHDDVLWLLDKATRGEQKKPAFRLENVIVKTSDAD